MKQFVIPIILWGYALSAVLAKEFWSGVYGKLLTTFDLSASQGWLLPSILNFFVACMGVPQIISFIVSLRRRDPIAASRYAAFFLCITAAGLSFIVSALGILSVRQHLLTAVSELGGGPESDVFSAGAIAQGHYSNTVVSVVMELPEGWHPMTLNGIRRAKNSGAYAAANDDTRQAEELSASRPGAYPLLAVRRYPDAYASYNPSLTISAYDKQAIAAAGISTLEGYANNFTGLQAPYHLRNGPSREQFGIESGYHIHIEARFPGGTIQQHVYATETPSFYVIVTASVMEGGDLIAMQRAIATLRFYKNNNGETKTISK